MLSCAELIIEDESAWQFISSHTEALLTTESEDRRIHLFNFCFRKQASNDTTEKEGGGGGKVKGFWGHSLPCLRILYFYLGLWGRKGVNCFTVWMDTVCTEKLSDVGYEILACPMGVPGETSHPWLSWL